MSAANERLHRLSPALLSPEFGQVEHGCIPTVVVARDGGQGELRRPAARTAAGFAATSASSR